MTKQRMAMPALGACVLMLVVTAAAAGCSGGGSTKKAASPTTTLSVAALKQQYFALVAPVNTALGQFAVPRSATGPGRAQLTAPLISALTTLDQALPKVAWPPKIRKDIDALVAVDRVLESDLKKAADLKAEQVPAWETQLHTDGTKLTAAVNVVLVDLGEPPVTTPTTRSTTATTTTSSTRGSTPPTS